MAEILIYGSYGYSGDLILRQALDAEIDAVAAGRNDDAVQAQARELGVESAVFDLENRTKMEEALSNVEAVIHCAGPFVHTAEPMLNASLATGTHYTDITGEINVIQHAKDQSEEAAEQEVMVMPGTAFDVVPTDCMAAHLNERLPEATSLSLGFDIMDAWDIAGGTLATAIENCTNDKAGVFLGNTVVRRDGRVESHPPAWRSREIDFGYASKQALTIPWGDIVTAYHTTGIPNIEVFAALNPMERMMVKSIRYIGWLYEFDAYRHVVSNIVQRYVSGPVDRGAGEHPTGVWGRAEDAQGNVVESRLRGPTAAYDIVAEAPVAIAKRILDGNAPPGFQTPAGAYGPDLVFDVADMEREDVQ